MTRRAAPQPIPTLLLTPEQAAAACQVSRAKLDEWTHRAGFPVIREGGIVRLPLELLKAWIDAEAQRTNAPLPVPFLTDLELRQMGAKRR